MIEKIVIISLVVFAIWYTMQEGEIFGTLGKWFYNNLPKKIHNPIFDCSVCMAPWYGSLIYWTVMPGTLKEWPIVVISSMGLNVVITRLWPERN